MKIIIIGAGLGGCTAGLCFAKHGHEVLVFEQRRTLSPQGSGLNIRPPASRILHNLGLKDDLEAISDETPTVLLRDLSSGDVAMRNVLIEASEYPDHGMMRDILIVLLHKRACEAGAQFVFGTSVKTVVDSQHKATVTMDDGTKHEADLTLAADGIRSRIRPQILEDPGRFEPNLSDTTLYGIKLEPQDVLNKESTHRLVDNLAINCWMGRDDFVVTRWNTKLQTFGALFAIKSQTDQQGMWDENGDINFERNRFSGACTELRTALMAAKSCDRWKLAEMPNLPRWTSKCGRIVLLGDSAHAMHPNAAQGFSQIVEDIGVLDYLISRSENPAAAVPKITEMWEGIRKPRAERIKDYAKWNTQLFLGQPIAERRNGDKAQTKSLRGVEPDMNANFHSAKFVKWALDHDPIEQARSYLEIARAKL